MSNTPTGDQKFKTFVFIFMNSDIFLTFRRKDAEKTLIPIMKWTERLTLALLFVRLRLIPGYFHTSPRTILIKK